MWGRTARYHPPTQWADEMFVPWPARRAGKTQQSCPVPSCTTITAAGVYREKPEHLAAPVVFVLDDPWTGDDSSDERFQRWRHPTRKPVCTQQRQTFQEEGCGNAA